jgi:uncharacterized membrane protein
MFIYYLIKFKWLIAITCIFASVVIGSFAIADHFETKGYNKALTEFQSLTNIQVKNATDKALTKANKEMQDTLDKQQLIFDSELQRVKEEKKVKVKYQKVVEYVDKIKIDSTCTSLDSSVVKLLNSSISNSNVSSN